MDEKKRIKRGQNSFVFLIFQENIALLENRRLFEVID